MSPFCVPGSAKLPFPRDTLSFRREKQRVQINPRVAEGLSAGYCCHPDIQEMKRLYIAKAHNYCLPKRSQQGLQRTESKFAAIRVRWMRIINVLLMWRWWDPNTNVNVKYLIQTPKKSSPFTTWSSSLLYNLWSRPRGKLALERAIFHKTVSCISFLPLL